DFPTYGMIMGVNGIRSAYESGRGSAVMQAKTMIEPGEARKSVIVVTELPYQVNKTNLVRDIADIAKQKKFDGILSCNDFSDKRGLRVEVEIRRDVNPNKALNYLLKHTSLRTSFSCIMLSLVDGVPRVCPLLDLLDLHVSHRKEVILRRTRFEIYRTMEALHLSEGYQIARRFLDEVIRVIRASQDAGEARVELVRQFGMSPLQATAILNMPLRRLTQLEQDALEQDYKYLLRKVQDLMDILTDEERLRSELRQEITELRDKFGDERRTRIVQREAGDFSEEDLIPEEEAIVSISRDGYIKRMSMDSYRQQKRGGKGLKSVQKADDEPAQLFQVNTHNTILFLTDRGRAYKLRAYEIPEASRYAKGMPVINYIAITGEERVTATISVKDLSSDGFLTMITRKGEVKRTALDAFANIRSNGLNAFDIEEGDELGWVLQTKGNEDLILVTRGGLSIRFNEQDARSRGRTAGGVRAISLVEDDVLVGADVVREGSSLLVVGEHGLGKRTDLSEYRIQTRGGKGILTMNVTPKTGFIVGAEVVDDKDRLIVMTVNGQGIRLKVKDVRPVGRVTQGVKLINLKEGDRVVSIARLVQNPETARDLEDEEDEMDQADLDLQPEASED
ncbi:MAG: DNA gyrase subunit A, partial [Fimbriimonadaceae bacterium]|nr:DNA gyrase subunit A [Fimbriimonadaceae bacterium]